MEGDRFLITYDSSRPDPVPQPVFCQVVGLDLGKLQDFSALASLTWSVPVKCPLGWKAEYSVPTLHRWPLGTPYKDVVSDVVQFFQTATAPAGYRCWKPLLVVDATGVGEAVVEDCYKQMSLAKVSGSLVGVTITSGSAVTIKANGRYNVAKKALVSTLLVLLGNRRLHVAKELKYTAVLLRELDTFSSKTTESLNEVYESWRNRDHDDLVLAVALSAWAATTIVHSEQPAPRRKERFRP